MPPDLPGWNSRQAQLVDLARGVMRKKSPDLTLALAGRFADDHAL
ncbi:hypothetical protein [Micromonospora sp. NPDC005305]